MLINLLFLLFEKKGEKKLAMAKNSGKTDNVFGCVVKKVVGLCSSKFVHHLRNDSLNLDILCVSPF